MNAMALTGAVALVSGGGRAIGREISLHLAGKGADVVLAARSVSAMEEVADQIRALGRRASVVEMDLSDERSVTQGVEKALAEFGQVDVLVNNSGVGGPSKPLTDLSVEEWEETFRVNVTGGFLLCRSVLPSMISRRKGSVVFIGSMTGKRPLVNRTPYAASKLAIVGLVRTLAAEVGPHGVRVNVVSPGAVEGERLEWVLTQQAEARGITIEQAREEFASSSPLRRLVTATDVAASVAFLASDEAGAITGEDLNVNTGVAMY